MSQIARVHARQILDSRGQPTVEVEVGARVGRGRPGGGAVRAPARARSRRWSCATAMPPRTRGKGVMKAVANVEDELAGVLVGQDASEQAVIDRTMIEFDGTPNKERLGANAILGCSLAVAQAAAADAGLPLYRYLGGARAHRLPVPLMNILNGGVHADNSVDLQEFMVAPVGARTFADALRMGAEVYAALKKVLRGRGLATGVGDEGGFAPDLGSNQDALEVIMEAIAAAGYTPGERDRAGPRPARPPSSTATGPTTWRARAARSTPTAWSSTGRPVRALSDHLHRGRHGRGGLGRLGRADPALGDRVQLVGDDLFVTNSQRLAKGIELGAGNAILIKVNQIGTLSETLAAMDLASRSGYASMVSHRSGETEDTFIADLAVATGAGQIKTGAPSRSERVAKYNQLIRIEEQLGPASSYPGRSAFRA